MLRWRTDWLTANHPRHCMPPIIVDVNTARGYRGGAHLTEFLIRGLATQNARQTLAAQRKGELSRRFTDVSVEVREVARNILSVAHAMHGVALVYVRAGCSVCGAFPRSPRGMP